MSKKPKFLPSSMRSKSRYIAFEVLSEDKISFDDLVNGIWYSTLNLIGEIGTSEASPWVSKDLYNGDKNLGVVKCSHTHVEEIKAALTFINRIGDTRVTLHVLGVTGTMKSARRKYLKMKDLSDY